jgi:hypothetical protein
MRTLFGTLATAGTLMAAAIAHAGNVGISAGDYYTPTLATTLTAQGNSVNAVSWYNDNVLSTYDVYIQDGSSFADAAALDRFVYNGGTLIQLPWSFTNIAYTTDTTVFSRRRRGTLEQLNPAIDTLAPSDWLLAGVTLPEAGTQTIGREIGNRFADGTTEVLAWEDGTALLGYRHYGAGLVIGFDVHLITADASPLAADWSNRIIANAISPVPESSMWTMLATGTAVLLLRRRRPA